MKYSSILFATIALLVLAIAFIPAVRQGAATFGKHAAELLHTSVTAHMHRNGLLLTMTTLAADKARAYELGDVRAYGVIAADIIYEGAAVGDNGSGYARPLVAGDPFRGFSESTVDNSAGAAGALNVRVKQRGIAKLAISALAITDVGKPVYASDDDTFTLTATSNSAIGRVIAWVSTGIGMVEFNAARGTLGSFTALTDSSGGTASDTLAAISATYVQAEVRNSIASLAAKINTIQAMLK